MTERLFTYDPLTDTTVTFQKEPDGTVLLRTKQDVTPVLDENKRLQNDGTGGWVSKAKEWRRAASIPVGVLEMWRVLHGIDWNKKEDMPKIIRMLNDPEWRHLRTAHFNIGSMK